MLCRQDAKSAKGRINFRLCLDRGVLWFVVFVWLEMGVLAVRACAVRQWGFGLGVSNWEAGVVFADEAANPPEPDAAAAPSDLAGVGEVGSVCTPEGRSWRWNFGGDGG